MGWDARGAFFREMGPLTAAPYSLSTDGESHKNRKTYRAHRPLPPTWPRAHLSSVLDSHLPQFR
jgi:hypothetical protein